LETLYVYTHSQHLRVVQEHIKGSMTNTILSKPFNAFLSGFSATVGQFVLTASLRIQTNPENKADFENISHERAFADFVLGSLLLHFFCVNFIN
jgi:hypothetical protein